MCAEVLSSAVNAVSFIIFIFSVVYYDNSAQK